MLWEGLHPAREQGAARKQPKDPRTWAPCGPACGSEPITDSEPCSHSGPRHLHLTKAWKSWEPRMGKWWERGAGINSQMVSTGLLEQLHKMEIKFSCKKKKVHTAPAGELGPEATECRSPAYLGRDLLARPLSLGIREAQSLAPGCTAGRGSWDPRSGRAPAPTPLTTEPCC